MMDTTAFEWKDIFTAAGAFVGMISALITALGTIAAYKLKNAENPIVVSGATVKILSLKEQRSLNWNVLLLKIICYSWLIAGPLGAGLIIWRLAPETKWTVTIILAVIAIDR